MDAAALAPVEVSLPPPQHPATVLAATEAGAAELKRKRTPSDPPPAPQKQQKTANAHLAINYLARQYDEDLPLVSTEDSLPSILNLVNEYQGVLERHESMACNLGARPLGPILIKRFERLFDGPPKILKNHGKDGNTVTWLDVVEFARSKPEQFVLGQMSEGMRVCQIHTKQCRVQISEEDFMLINSGMPQNLIPPQPIVEDEEKELGTLEILDKNLSSISHLADQGKNYLAARTRQLKHRINGRRSAILERRANEPGAVIRGTSPSVLNGSGVNFAAQSPYNESNGRPAEYSKTGASAATRSELLGKFITRSEKERRDAERYGLTNGDTRRTSSMTPQQLPRMSSSGSQQHHPQHQYRDLHPGENRPYHTYPPAVPQHDRGFSSHVNKFRQAPPAPNSYGDNISTHAFTVPQSSATAGVIKEVKSENDGPYRAEMVVRMEALKKGDRVLPPCDRCRRLHMDCIKNLTACAGCTKKHAKCSWRDVRESELWGPEKGKVPIPSVPIASGMEPDPRDREPSVGLRPTDHASQQLLQALGGAEHHQPEQHHHNGNYSRDPRTLALEGLSAAEQHANGHDSHITHGEYPSPSHPPQPPSYPSRTPSNGPHAPYAQEPAPPPPQYPPYDAPLPSREVGPERS